MGDTNRTHKKKSANSTAKTQKRKSKKTVQLRTDSAQSLFETLRNVSSGTTDFKTAFSPQIEAASTAADIAKKAQHDHDLTYKVRQEALADMQQKMLDHVPGSKSEALTTIPAEDGHFVVHGTIRDEADNKGLAHVKVRLKDLDRKSDDILAETYTDFYGNYTVDFSEESFDDPDKKPEVYIEVLDDANKTVQRSSKTFQSKTQPQTALSLTTPTASFSRAVAQKQKRIDGENSKQKLLKLNAQRTQSSKRLLAERLEKATIAQNKHSSAEAQPKPSKTKSKPSTSKKQSSAAAKTRLKNSTDSKKSTTTGTAKKHTRSTKTKKSS